MISLSRRMVTRISATGFGFSYDPIIIYHLQFQSCWSLKWSYVAIYFYYLIQSIILVALG
jgi:hypothetical protein